MILNQALFADNGGCGYVLKPEILRQPNLFDPNDITTMQSRKRLQLRIISGHRLSLRETKDDPFVAVKIYGVPADTVSTQKTKPIKNNAHNPQWNETFEFTVHCPELAIVKFSVKDKDVGKDDSIGEFAIRFDSMRNGKRRFFGFS